MINNVAYNLSTGNKWILVIPFKKISTDLKIDNFSLNLTNFSIPSLTQNQAEFSYRGRSIPLPTGVRDEDKSITFNYMLSSDWAQYKVLYKWFNMSANFENEFNESYRDVLLDISVFVLSEFKKPLFSIIFRGCWISTLGEIDFNYQQGEENIQTYFTINYASYEFDGLI